MVTTDQHSFDPSEEENDDLPFSAVTGHFQHIFKLKQGLPRVRRIRPFAPAAAILAETHDDYGWSPPPILRGRRSVLMAFM